jgi:hypothetical protein
MKNSSPASLEVTFKDNLCVANMTGEGLQWLLLVLESEENEPELESKRSPTPGEWLNEVWQIDLCNG